MFNKRESVIAQEGGAYLDLLKVPLVCGLMVVVLLLVFELLVVLMVWMVEGGWRERSSTEMQKGQTIFLALPAPGCTHPTF